MRKLRVYARDLAFALRGRAPGTVHYLDLETGDVIPVFAFNRERVLATVRAEPGRYLRLAPRAGRHDYAVMSRFVETVDDDALRGRLRSVIDGAGAFARFRAELEPHRNELTRWEHYRAEQAAADLARRLLAQDIELALEFD
ncbi:MAG: UPF0158 family protein [bacterium]